MRRDEVGETNRGSIVRERVADGKRNKKGKAKDTLSDCDNEGREVRVPSKGM